MSGPEILTAITEFGTDCLVVGQVFKAGSLVLRNVCSQFKRIAGATETITEKQKAIPIEQAPREVQQITEKCPREVLSPAQAQRAEQIQQAERFTQGQASQAKAVTQNTARLKNPTQVIGRTKHFIETAHTKIEQLEAYVEKRMSELLDPPFEKINARHNFCIEKEIKERANGTFDAKYRGYHHDHNWSFVQEGKVEFLTEPIICPKTGAVYVKEVAIDGIPIGEKTFFSPKLIQKQVLDRTSTIP